jgi:hypothetical protein
MSHDPNAVGYTVDGHKYVGWPLLEAEIRAEFLPSTLLNKIGDEEVREARVVRRSTHASGNAHHVSPST